MIIVIYKCSLAKNILPFSTNQIKQKIALGYTDSDIFKKSDKIIKFD